MKERTARAISALAAPALLCTVALYAFTIAIEFGIISDFGSSAPEVPLDFDEILWTMSWFGFPVVGFLIVRRQPGNRIGLILTGIGLSIGFLGAVSVYSYRALVLAPGTLPFARQAAWMSTWSAGPVVALLVLLVVLFPSGIAETRPQRLVVRATMVLVPVMMLAYAFRPAPVDAAKQLIPNPYGIASLAWLDTVVSIVVPLLAFVFVASVVGLLVRMHRARGERKQQLRLFAYAAALFPVLFGIGITFENSGLSVETVNIIISSAFFLSFVGLAVAIGVAVTKYKLYGIDALVSKTLAFAVLATFVTAVYSAIVVGLGSALGSRDNIALSIAATTFVAIAFEPVRARVHRLVNRLVYGQRATPYEVLSTLSEQFRAAGTDLPATMASVLREGTGAAGASVLLRDGETLTVIGHSGAAGGADADLLVPINDGGEELGALSIKMGPGDPVTQTERKLVEQLASQAGLVLRNVRLRRELQARLDELRESRQRLVKAQDEERRRLERDLHDGAQQMLVALKIKANIAATVAQSDAVRGSMEQIGADTAETIRVLRELAHGIYPPLLASDGLGAALRAHAAKSPLDVTVDAEQIGRYPQEVEAAVYFCVLEALQNAAKYAKAEQVAVILRAQGATLTFEVTDRGAGFDVAATQRGAGTTNMNDRITAIDGTLQIESAPGRGTTVRGVLPIPSMQRA